MRLRPAIVHKNARSALECGTVPLPRSTERLNQVDSGQAESTTLLPSI